MAGPLLPLSQHSSIPPLLEPLRYESETWLPSRFQPAVRVYNADGTELGLICARPDLPITYDKLWLMKQVAGEETNGSASVWRYNAPGDSSALSNDKTADVIFSLGFTSTIVRIAHHHYDTLPTYVNAAGQSLPLTLTQLRTLTGRLSPDGRTVTLT